MTNPIRVPVRSQVDAERAERLARALAGEIGLGAFGAESVALATLELASNLVRYATDGELRFARVDGTRGVGLQVESLDSGPGITDVQRALEDGFSTHGSLGGGLPGVRRLMDEFDIASSSGGTRVLACKWANSKSP
jgi:serine/threonine-protein kinase RsbT